MMNPLTALRRLTYDMTPTTSKSPIPDPEIVQ
jgi:hypothetical protein